MIFDVNLVIIWPSICLGKKVPLWEWMNEFCVLACHDAWPYVKQQSFPLVMIITRKPGCNVLGKSTFTWLYYEKSKSRKLWAVLRRNFWVTINYMPIYFNPLFFGYFTVAISHPLFEIKVLPLISLIATKYLCWCGSLPRSPIKQSLLPKKVNHYCWNFFKKPIKLLQYDK